MAKQVLLLVGTQRGIFLVSSNEERRSWQVRGPLGNAGWSYLHLCYDQPANRIFASGVNAWYGPAVWRSADGGESWQVSSEGITYGDQAAAIRKVWHLTPWNGGILAGVDPAGLFYSADGGTNWAEVAGLRNHPSYAAWQGGSAGLMIHSIVLHPSDPQQVWVASAGGGVLHSGNGGRTWAERNTLTPDGRPRLRPQKLLRAPGQPEWLYQQNHEGVFFSPDGGRTWADRTADLPTPFGFPLALHPTDPQTLYAIPHLNESGVRHIWGGAIAVWRSRNGGESWERLDRGLPQGQAFVKVLRDGMATDTLSPGGVYFGTSSGHLFGSFDEGESWITIAAHLPEIQSVSAVVLDH